MLELPGYDLVERLFENDRTVAFRGVRRADGARVVVKVSSADYPPPSVLAALRNEHEIGHLVDAPGVPRMLGLERCRNGLALVMEDIGAVSLHAFLAAAPLSVAAFLPIAIALAEAIDALHARRILHKDLKPDNVVIDPASGRVQIIDFGIASRLSQEIREAESPGVLEGTLLYMAPEQTGRMNRPVDSRADVYSLGATFYEMLTGAPPFSAADPVELVHCHLARAPRPPREIVPEIPEPLSRLVLKMLEKRAEDRYQTCRGLRADLEECRRRLSASGTVDGLVLGRDDVPDRFRLEDRLYGRDAEIELLGRAIAPGAGSRTRIVLVSGYSGIGKSSILREMEGPVVSRGGYFVTGKFDQLQRNVPYGGVAGAMADLFRQILSESDDRLALWRARLLEAVGPNGRLVTELVPIAERVLGPQPAVSDLLPAETRNRFEAVLRAVFGAFAAPARPILLFLDDLQWADGASLRVVEILARDPTLHDLLLVGAYRDNEVDDAHPLRRAVSVLEKEGTPVERLHLGPLALADVARLCSGAVHRDDDDAQALARAVFDKTLGNPFFVRELLRTLAEEGKLRFDRREGRWTWDLAEIEALALSSNAVDLVSRRIAGLDPEPRRVLSLGAALGHGFELSQLAAVAALSPVAAARALAPAVHLGLLVPLGAAQQLIGWIEASAGDLPSPACFRFPHDRVQQAAYAEIPAADRPRVHLEIGRRRRASLPSAEREAELFVIVDHLDQGEALVVDPGERRALADDNLRAARRARASTAYGAALAYLDVGRRCLPSDAWTSRHAEAFAFDLLRAECEYLSGDFAAAEQRFRDLLLRARARADKARIYRLVLALHTSQGKAREAVEVGIAAARLYGVRLRAHPTKVEILPDLARVRLALRRRDATVLDALQVVADPSMRELLGLLSEVAAAAFFVDKNLWAQVGLKSAGLALAHGVSPEAGAPFTVLAALFSGVLGDRAFGRALGEGSLRLVERFSIHAVRPRAVFVLGAFLTHGQRHLREAVPLLRDAYRYALEVGDLVYAGFAVGHLLTALVLRGDPLDDIEAEGAWAGPFQRQIGFAEGVLAAEVLTRAIRRLRGPGATPGEGEHDARAFVDRLEASAIKFALHLHVVMELRRLLVFGDAAGARRLVERSEALLATSAGMMLVPEHHFLAALALLGAARGLPPKEAASLVRGARAHLDVLSAFARDCPENFAHKEALVRAEVAAAGGAGEEAMLLYERAARGADDQDYVPDAALACDLAARFYRARGLPDLARHLDREATQRYARWGATARGGPRHGDDPAATRTLSATSKATLSGSAALDLVSVLKASQAISGEVALDRLLSKLMLILLENVGAERAVLLLVHKDQLCVEADAAIGRVELLPATPLPGCGRVPESMVQYVARSLAELVIEDARHPGRFSADPYVAGRAPRSILCAPVLDQGRLVGVLYFENSLAAGAFTKDRLQVLAILSAQAAISIENARLYTAYGRFVPHELCAQLGRRSMVDVGLGDQVAREMTVLFSDIRSFTELAERMTPEECFGFVNEYLGRAGPVIRRHGGFIDKYIGDAIMALFPGSADDAVRAAGGLLHELSAFNDDRRERGLPSITIGVGLNTGRVMLGTVGEAGRMDGTVIGDAVNLASRIEGLTKHYGASLLIAGETFDRLTDKTILARPVGRVQVKGKDAPVVLHEVFAADPPALRESKRATLGAFEEGLALYAAGAFAAAAARFRTCAPDDRPAALYAERCAGLQQTGAPEGWSGVTRFEEK
jgi:predicted ATPase/class 3 adenylate cyclase